MKIKPLDNIVYFKPAAVKAGILDTSSVPTAVEYAEVIAVGNNVKNIKEGDKIFVKSWAPDSVTYSKETYRFVNIESNAILAVVEEGKE